MAITVPVFEPVMGAMVPIPQVPMKTAMVAPAHAVPMDTGVLVVDPVVGAIMPLFEAIVLTTMAIAPVVVRRRGRRHAQRHR